MGESGFVKTKESQKGCSLWGSLTQGPPGDGRRGRDAPGPSTARRGHQTVGSNPCSGARPGSLSGCYNTKSLIFTSESRKNMDNSYNPIRIFFKFVKFSLVLCSCGLNVCLPYLSLNSIFERQDLNLSFMLVGTKASVIWKRVGNSDRSREAVWTDGRTCTPPQWPPQSWYPCHQSAF